MRARRAAALLAMLGLGACATQPEPGGGGEALPNAGAGPFRALVDGELGNLRSPPYALDDDRAFARDPAVIDLDGDPATLEVAGYFGAAVPQGKADPGPGDPTRAIVRVRAIDARSFDLTEEPALVPTEPWEGGVIGQPAALRRAGEVLLYYAAAGGIGMARSPDSHVFTRVPGPVLAPVAGGWENGAVPASPGVVALADGSLRMFYEVTVAGGVTAIGEARSSDGVIWTRVGDAAALAARPAKLGEDAPYDAASVGSPSPVLATSTSGQTILRVYYGARDFAGTQTIGLAARFGDDGPLERAAAPVFGTSKPTGASEPCVLVYPTFTLLFATAPSGTTSAHPAVGVGLAPATAPLPAANPL